MMETNSIAMLMLELQEAFKRAKAFVETGASMEAVHVNLENQATRFLSIGYEAAAMAFALKDLEAGTDLQEWHLFLASYGNKHAVQIHIGLGWALAQQRLDARPFVEALAPLLGYRVLDGYGYYDGFFRRRKALQGLRPEWLDAKSEGPYLQGIGRSFWYSSKGNVDKVVSFIEKMPQKYRTDLWRGLGIASTYVGGGDSSDWKSLWEAADAFQASLAAGAAMAVKSRVEAQTLEQEAFSLSWCGLTAHEIVLLLKQKEPSGDVANEIAYHQWVQAIDHYFESKAG